MALRLRRGTDAERLTITPQIGELIYVTDTNELWVGDGNVGGILVSVIGSPSALDKDLDLANYSIVGNGIIGDNNTSFVGDGSALTNVSGITEGSFYRIGIVGDDSTPLVDPETNTVNGIHTGDGSGLTDISINNISEIVITSPIEGEVLTYTGGVWQSIPPADPFNDSSLWGQDLAVNVVSADSQIMVNSDNGTFGKINSNESIDLTLNSLSTEGIVFNNYGGTLTSPTEPANNTKHGLTWNSYNPGTLAYQTDALIFGYHKTGFAGGIIALTPVNVAGTGFFENAVQIDSNVGVVTLSATTRIDVDTLSPVRLPRLTTAERDGLTALVGDIIYNTDTSTFQGYAGGTWTSIEVTPAIINIAASRALAITDATDILEIDTSGGAVDVSILDNATVAFPIGTVINITLVDPTSAATVTAGAGVTLNGVSAGSGLVTSTAYSGVSLYKRATDAWVVQGAIGTVA
jgi:hypothetical protein